jgi:hypothetical protein
MESVMSASSNRGSPAVWGVAVQRQWRRRPGGGAFHLWLRPSLKIGIGFGQWGVAAAAEPRTVSRGLTSFFIAQCDGGPPTANGLSVLDQGASQGPSGHWAILVGDQSNRKHPCTASSQAQAGRLVGKHHPMILMHVQTGEVTGRGG